MPPRHGGAPPGPSPGPQDAYSAQRLFPTLLTAAVKLDPAIAWLDPQHLRRAFHNKWVVRPPPPGDIEAASAILLAAARQVARAAQSNDDPFESAPQHRILNSYHHLPHLDKPTFKPLNAPSPW